MVSDALASSELDTVEISTEVLSPIAHAGQPQSVPVGTTVTLDGSESYGLNGLPLSYEWTFAENPTESRTKLMNADTVYPQFTVDVAGKGTPQSPSGRD